MGLTLPELQDLLAIDLAVTVDTEMSKAQLNRSVQRAVDDLSRYFPKEEVHEETLVFTVAGESFTTPAAYAADAHISVANLIGKSDGDIVAITDYTPDVPRRLSVTITDSSNVITQLTAIVKGIDQDGNYVEESWYRKDLATTVATHGKLYFKRLIEVEIDQIAGNTTGTLNMNVGNGNAYDSWIFLANRPIRPDSETVTSSPAGTTYARDTDYRMDYTNGAIKFINGGGMAAGTAYLIDHTKSRLGINISDLLPVVTKISKVQYPVDLVPQQFVSFNIVGDFMYIATKLAGQSQEELTAGKHLAIWYERKHMPPSEHSPGSYPDVLDEVIVIGAGGYALLTEAQQLEQQAAIDLTLIRTTLDYLGIGGGTGTNTLLYKDIDDALDKVADYLETNNTTDNAKDRLAEITDMEAYLRDMITKLSDGSGAIADANTHLDEVDTTDLAGATPDSAETALAKYEDKIDGVNTGARVGELGADYARAWTEIAAARTNAAMGYIQEANTRLSLLRSYIEESAGWTTIGQTFIAEAQARFGEAGIYLAETQQLSETVNGDLVLADRFRAEGLSRLNEFHQILRNKAESRRRTSSIPTKQPA